MSQYFAQPTGPGGLRPVIAPRWRPSSSSNRVNVASPGRSRYSARGVATQRFCASSVVIATTDDSAIRPPGRRSRSRRATGRASRTRRPAAAEVAAPEGEASRRHRHPPATRRSTPEPPPHATSRTAISAPSQITPRLVIRSPVPAPFPPRAHVCRRGELRAAGHAQPLGSALRRGDGRGAGGNGASTRASSWVGRRSSRRARERSLVRSRSMPGREGTARNARTVGARLARHDAAPREPPRRACRSRACPRRSSARPPRRGARPRAPVQARRPHRPRALR